VLSGLQGTLAIPLQRGPAILRGDIADGVRTRAAIEPLKQSQRDGAALVAWVLLVELRRMDDIHLRLDRASKAIHASKALRHAVESGEIANEMLGAAQGISQARSTKLQ